MMFSFDGPWTLQPALSWLPGLFGVMYVVTVLVWPGARLPIGTRAKLPGSGAPVGLRRTVQSAGTVVWP